MCKKNIRDICKAVGFSKFWIYKWYKRYLTGDENWFKDRSKIPHNIPHKTQSDVEQSVISIRRKLVQNNDFKGAQAIQWEMQDLGFETIPPISTINAILKRHNLTEPKKRRYEPKGKIYPTIECQIPNILHQVDFLGPRYLACGIRFYSLNLMDIFTHRVGIELSQSMHDEIVVNSLISIWKRIDIPKYLQLDNQLPFRGSNRYPRSYGLVIRLCISLNIEPIFIPVKEPWRNGCIEKFGDIFKEYFFRKYHFNSFDHLIEETQKFEDRHNHNYRYSFLKGKTPMKVFDENNKNIQYLPQDYQFHPEIRVSKGYIHLIRFIRSNRKLDIFGEKFTAPKEFIYEYLWCTIDVEEQKMKLFLNNKQIEEYDYKLPKS
jgi:transposase InsO family protein